MQKQHAALNFPLASGMMGLQRTEVMIGLCSNLETDMPTNEARASQEASVAAKRVQLVALSRMGQG